MQSIALACVFLLLLAWVSSFHGGAPSSMQARRLLRMGQFDGLKEELKSSGTTMLKKSSAAAKGVVEVVSEVRDLPATPETVGVLTEHTEDEEVLHSLPNASREPRTVHRDCVVLRFSNT